MQLKHPTKKGRVTIPIHSGDIAIGTYKSILKQAQIERKKDILHEEVNIPRSF